MRAMDLFPPVTAPGEGLSIWRFTNHLIVNYSDSDLPDNKTKCPEIFMTAFRGYV